MRIIITLLFALTISLVKAEKIKVIATTSIIGDIASSIANEYIDIDVIVPIGGDPHNYEPIPSDIKRLQNTQLILVNGLGLEGWMKDLHANSETKAPIINTTDGVNAIQSEEYKNSFDPHVWMDPTNGIVYVKNIIKGLTPLLNADQLTVVKANEAKYIDELKTLNDYITNEISKIPETQRVLVTNHDAFKYYGRKFGLKLESVLGVTTEADVQTGDIQRVAKTIKKMGVPTIFVETTINPQMIEQIAKDNNITVGGALYSDSLGKKGSDGGTYIEMLRSNTNKIVSGLSKIVNTTEHQDNKSNYLMPLFIGGALLLGFLFFFLKMNRSHE